MSPAPIPPTAPEADREPIVSAVLADPVVQAVLAAPSAAPAVADAISPGAAAALAPARLPPAPVPAAPIPAVGTVQPGQVGGAAPNKPDVMVLASGLTVAAPTTTQEEERTSAGQRLVNMMWEITQAAIALSVVFATLYTAMKLALSLIPVALALTGKETESTKFLVAASTAAFVFLYGAANLVVGFYFGRTNHQRVGGVGGSVAGR